jgi:hypothetical protein
MLTTSLPSSGGRRREDRLLGAGYQGERAFKREILENWSSVVHCRAAARIGRRSAIIDITGGNHAVHGYPAL